MFKLLAGKNQDAGHARPLVIFTSGCKDYGMTSRPGDPNLQPHTEHSPLNGPAYLRPRTEMSSTVFDYKDSFDAVLTRPTTFYGSSGTFYAPLFTMAQQAAHTTSTLILHANPKSIMHGTHVNDVASAYVAIASASRKEVTGHVFNISSHRYETAAEVAAAVEKSYDIKVELVDPKGWSETEVESVRYLMDFSLWVDSSKLRQMTGWADQMPLFTEDFERYRKVFEAFAKDGDEKVVKMNRRVGAANDAK
ncbi:hypothetical protein PMZ80_006211 [Knufia obscura]|uniref:NAD-dependent epimerase/dehydratase domain-containing protein n=1 Tax=Knufia obscura TaxID=1635080 RepID=A0ABR0RK04_9EURO|nr:hypothetical protein PMZ80_006211 [Knufia obscura]